MRIPALSHPALSYHSTSSIHRLSTDTDTQPSNTSHRCRRLEHQSVQTRLFRKIHTEQQAPLSHSSIDDLRSHERCSDVNKDGSRIPITHIQGPPSGSCRKTKTKCTRERPICSSCTRRSSICVYGPKNGSQVPITKIQAPACQSCQIQKVKCDREKSGCTRCTQSGRTCIYHPETSSEWTGKQGSRPTACKSCRRKRTKCSITTPGCTARAKEKVHSNPTSPAGSGFPPDNATANTTDDTVTNEQQDPTGGSLVDQSMLDGSQEETEAQLQEAEEMQRLRWEGGIDIVWVEQGSVKDLI